MEQTIGRESERERLTSMAYFCTLLVLFLYCFSRELYMYSAADDTITATKFLKDPQFLVSKSATFKLGFFSPDPSSPHRYLGIWFNKESVMTVVWVANQGKPINDSSGILTISHDGNLQLVNGKNETMWSSNLSNIPTTNNIAQLQDLGNFVLLHSNSIDPSSNPTIIWQSFDHATDTFLPGMTVTVPRIPNRQNNIFRAWRTPSDPSEGSFTISIDTTGLPQILILNNGSISWRTGPWDGRYFIGISGTLDSHVRTGVILEDNPALGTIDMLFLQRDASILLNFVIDTQGRLIERYWNWENNNWTIASIVPVTECDYYAKCGAFGTCNPQLSPICRCLQGFQPQNEEEWRKGNWSSGCVRRTKLQCGTHGGKRDVFLRLQNTKVPDNVEKVSAVNEDSCRRTCLNNCSCAAYIYHLTIGCMIWTNDLIDIQKYASGGLDLFLRLASSELENKAYKKIAIIASVAITGMLIVIFVYFLRRRITKKGKQVKSLNEGNLRESSVQHELPEPPYFTFEMLKKATNNFQDTNKIGEGGFGPVYRGILEDGKEIAVKRLSRTSEQGIKEFMNEVVMISNLQHRNLVKLLGCCIRHKEKMLVYEYMPNKSLDVFIFDPQSKKMLTWEKRRNIIDGISRGLLYLHRDSRLKIIHRDLTASNILLDEHFNPKISDFGMARIFRENREHASTTKVLGTYGYMSPEYTIGQFSEKSDVYSFGVILLEIVSGRSNISFDHTEQCPTIMGYAWKLWNEDRIGSLIDPTISQPYFRADILRCIHVGLLCVQKNPKDRPSISALITMLDNSIQRLQSPKRPAFVASDTSSNEQQGEDMANLSTSTIQGR